jgi:hypothetical protein
MKRRLTTSTLKAPLRQLNEVQRYLLSRIPGEYQFTPSAVPDPAAIKKMRAAIAKYERRIDKRDATLKDKFKAARRKAIDAVYFDTTEHAKTIVDGIREWFDIKPD